MKLTTRPPVTTRPLAIGFVAFLVFKVQASLRRTESTPLVAPRRRLASHPRGEPLSMKLIIGVILLLSTFSVQALTLKDIEFQPKKVRELRSRRAALTSKATHKRLSRVHTAMSNDDYDRALRILKKLETQTQSRPFELAQIYQIFGFVYANKNNIKAAIDYFNKSLALKTLPTSPTLSSMYTVAQLKVGQEDYKGGLNDLVDWFHHIEKPNAQAYVLAATALFELKKKKSALVFINKAIEKMSNPQESWLQFAVALNYENKNYKDAAAALEMLTGRYPHKKKYWKQLTGVYLNLDKTTTALATIQMAYKMGHLVEEKELLNMVSLQLSEGLPYKGAKALENFIQDKKVKKNKKHFEILAQAWIQAEELERAIGPMEKAATLSSDGKVAAKQGHLLLELEKFKLAVKAYSMSLDKGGLKYPGRIYLSRGIAKFNLKDYQGAIADFKKAMKMEKTDKAAEQWINYVNLEKKYSEVL